MAADSYYKGASTSEKMKALTTKIFEIDKASMRPKIPAQRGSHLDSHPWIKKTLEVCDNKTIFFYQQPLWLLTWFRGREAITHETNNREIFVQTIAKRVTFSACPSETSNERTRPASLIFPNLFTPQNALNHIIARLPQEPYALHHLERSVFAHYAYVWIPSLFNIKENETFLGAVENILPSDPNLGYLIAITTKVRQAFENALSANEPGETCSRIVDATWQFFHTLNAPISRSHWHVSSSLLQSIDVILRYSLENPCQTRDLFAFREDYRTHSKPRSLSYSDYCSLHHTRPFLRQQAESMHKTLNTLEDYLPNPTFSTPQKTNLEGFVLSGTFRALQACIDTVNITTKRSTLQLLIEQTNNLQTLLWTRCTVVWHLCKNPQNPHSMALYYACTPAEKKYLTLKANRADDTDPRKRTLTKRAPSMDEDDIERITCQEPNMLVFSS